MKDLIFALIWLVVLGIYIFVSWKKEITQMNELLLEQNTQLRKQNDHLNMVIVSVCSKSVRDRKNTEGGKDAQTETSGKQAALEKETRTKETTTTADRGTTVSS